jgi:hypothetical protein
VNILVAIIMAVSVAINCWGVWFCRTRANRAMRNGDIGEWAGWSSAQAWAANSAILNICLGLSLVLGVS